MKRLILLAALCAGVSAPLAAQLPTTPPAIGAPKPFSLPKSESYTLPNGMQVTILPYGTAPKVAVWLRIDGGNLAEGQDTWLADVTGDMMKQGAAGRSGAQLAQAAAEMGGDLIVSVAYQNSWVATNVLSDHATDAVGLVADVALRPDFPASELERVKTNYSQLVTQSMSQPGTLADVAMMRAIYGTDHAYGRPFPTQAQLASYDIEDVRGYYRTNYGAKRAHLYIAGKFDMAAMKAAIAKAFNGWAPGPDPLVPSATPTSGPRVILVDRPDAPQSTLRLTYPAPMAGSEHDIETRVMDALLSGSFSSRITRNIREDKGYTYSPYSSTRFRPDTAQWVFAADVTTDVTGPALKEVFGEIRRLQAEAPGAEEAAGSRTYLAGTFAINNSTASDIIGSIADRNALGLSADWLDTYVPSVLAVTPAQISQAATRLIPLDKMTLVVVGDLAKVEPQLKALPELQGMTFQRVTVP